MKIFNLPGFVGDRSERFSEQQSSLLRIRALRYMFCLVSCFCMGCDSSSGTAKNAATPAPTPAAVVNHTGLISRAVNVSENTDEPVFNIYAIDGVRGEPIDFIVGFDEIHFVIDIDSGNVHFVDPPNYDLPNDANFDNEYEVNIAVGGNAEREIHLTVNILDAAEYTPDDRFSELRPWTTYRGTEQHTGYVPLEIDVDAINPLWVTHTDFNMHAPVAYGNTMFISDGEDSSRTLASDPYRDPGIHAVDVTTGAILWSRKHDEFHANNETYANAGDAFSPPAYADGKIYITAVSFDGYRKLIALDADTGGTLFETSEFTPLIDFPVTPYAGDLYFTPDENPFGIVRISGTDGSTKWFFDFSDYPMYFSNTFTPVPTLSDSRLFLQSVLPSTLFFVVDVNTGKLESAFGWACSGDLVSSSSTATAVPYLSDNSVVALTRDCITSFAADFATLGGENRWTHHYPVESRLYDDVYADPENIYGLHNQVTPYIEAFDRSTGLKKWEGHLEVPDYDSAIVTKGHLIVSSRTHGTRFIRLSDGAAVKDLTYGGEIGLTENGYLMIAGRKNYSVVKLVAE